MPNSPRYVVTNTTPLIALDLIGKLHLLHDLYDEVLMPQQSMQKRWQAEKSGWEQ